MGSSSVKPSRTTRKALRIADAMCFRAWFLCDEADKALSWRGF